MRRLLIGVCGLAAMAMGQEVPKQPPVKVSVLNVCTPNEAEQKEMAIALTQVPRRPNFSSDFEVARGHSSLESSASDWVRIRRDFAGGNFTAAQFLYSREDQAGRETVVFFSKEAKGVTQIALEDKASAATSPATMLSTNTPVSRISLERFGKPHLVLARCPDTDQSRYEPLFNTATEIMSTYRTLSGARDIVPGELGRLSLGIGPGYRPPKAKPMKKR